MVKLMLALIVTGSCLAGEIRPASFNGEPFVALLAGLQRLQDEHGACFRDQHGLWADCRKYASTGAPNGNARRVAGMLKFGLRVGSFLRQWTDRLSDLTPDSEQTELINALRESICDCSYSSAESEDERLIDRCTAAVRLWTVLDQINQYASKKMVSVLWPTAAE